VQQKKMIFCNSFYNHCRQLRTSWRCKSGRRRPIMQGTGGSGGPPASQLHDTCKYVLLHEELHRTRSLGTDTLGMVPPWWRTL
jgi:hypothetical protein